MDSVKTCLIDGCPRPARTKGFCDPHYKRLWRNGSPTAGRITPGTRFEWIENHKEHSEGECLLWPFSVTRGYGTVIKTGKTIYVHRLMCEHKNGPAPTPKHQAAHSCGNKGCVNPNHIRWATRSENESDKELHGTRIRGTDINFSKLTETDVASIRASPLKQSEIAKLYGVDQSHVSNIKTRKVWSWLP